MKALVLFSMLFLAACSAKVDAGDFIPSGLGNSAKIEGPRLDGTWESTCVEGWQQYKRIITLTFAGAAAQRTEDIFSDNDCKVPLNKQTLTGSHQYVKNSGSGVYQIEYAFNLPDGVTQFVTENVKLDQSGNLMMSYYSTETAPYISLTKK